MENINLSKDFDKLEELKEEVNQNDLIYVLIQDHYAGNDFVIYPSYIAIIGRVLSKFGDYWTLEIWNSTYIDDYGMHSANYLDDKQTERANYFFILEYTIDMLWIFGEI